MTQAVNPQGHPASSVPGFSADDYYWAEKRGDTTARSLIYSLAAPLMLLGITSAHQQVGHWWVYYVASIAILLYIGISSPRKKTKVRLPRRYSIPTTILFLGLLVYLFGITADHPLQDLHWRLPAVMALAFVYARFVGPGYVRVPGQPQDHPKG